MLEKGRDKINSHDIAFLADKKLGSLSVCFVSLSSWEARILYLKKVYVCFVLSRKVHSLCIPCKYT